MFKTFKYIYWSGILLIGSVLIIGLIANISSAELNSSDTFFLVLSGLLFLFFKKIIMPLLKKVL